MKLTYLLVDFFTVIIPLIFSFHPRIKFNKQFKYLFPANLVAAFVFIVWDIIFTTKGIWGFDDDYILGYRIINLPIEEYLFFFCIPFSCIFTYYCFNTFFTISWPKTLENAFVLCLSFYLLVTGVFNVSHYYTSVTFLSTAILLLVLKFYFRENWFAKFFTIYPVLLIPFFVVNGILTGSGLKQPVVWYNNNFNLGIRLFTIPVEDIFYGMELLILVLFFYIKFQRKNS